MFEALLGAVAAPLIGGLFNRSTNRANSAAQAGMNDTDRRYNNQIRRQDRFYHRRDREYAEQQLAKDRAYAATLLAGDRKYTRKNFKADRDYDRRIALQDRAGEREYLATRLADDRAYADNQRSADRAEYIQDRDAIQLNTERLARETAASRGIDFSKLVSDAQAAGFNPMTALGMAHAYSTEVNYADGRSPYANRANFQVAGSGYNAAGGGGSVGGTSATPMSTPIPSGVAPGGFSSPGSGFRSQFNPALSSGAFVADAVERGVDTWFNRPPEKDKLAESLRTALQAQNLADQSSDAAPPRNFGYDLTEVRPFRPAASERSAPLARPSVAGLSSPSDESVTPSKLPIKIFGQDFEPSGLNSDAAAIEDRYGDVASWAYGVTNLATDAIDNAQKFVGRQIDKAEAAYLRASGKTVHKIDGKYYVQSDETSPPISRGASGYWGSGTRKTYPRFHPANP